MKRAWIIITLLLVAASAYAAYAAYDVAQQADCPPDPPTSTPWPVQVTYTPEYTHTPPATNTPTPTCPPTATTIIRPSPTPYPTNTPYPVLTSTLTIWFEQGFDDLAQCPQGGPCSGRPDIYGPFDFVEQGNWCSYYDPLRNILALEHDNVHSGTTSLRMEMNRPGPIPFDWRRINVGIEWDKHIPDPEAFVSVWLYLPDSFVVNDWIIPLDFKQPNYGKWYLYFSPTYDTHLIFRHIWVDRPDGAIIPPQNVRATHPLPRGRWVRIQIYYRRGWDNGQITVWHDTDDGFDVKVLDVSGFTSHAPAGGLLRFLLRYYSPEGPNWLLWDGLVMADGWVPRGYVVVEQ